VLPVHHVDTSSLKKYTSRLTGGRLFPRCRQTVTKQLKQRFDARKQELKIKLACLDCVCTTADCWTSRRRSFLGVTVHWLDSDNLMRKGGCLAVRQIEGRHTYDTLGRVLESINTEFGISDKTCFVVTDSGANFLKAFQHFSMEESEDYTLPTDPEETGEGNAGDDTEDEMVFEEIDHLMDPSSDADTDEQSAYKLPSHRKCACHLLNLVATVDARNIQGITKRTSVQTFAKLMGLWNKQNRSTTAAGTIRQTLGSLLVTPGETRWNSTYEAVRKVHAVLSDPDLEAKFDKLCDELIS